MIKTVIIIALALAVLALLVICFWQIELNGRLKERLYEAEEELELAPIPWGQSLRDRDDG